MIAILDVDYRENDTAVAACVTAHGFGDTAPVGEYTVQVSNVGAYVPGQFYRRELPCLLAVLATLPAPPTVCVVDGYVWLGDTDTPGLGAHLFTALNENKAGSVAVVGVAKTLFPGAEPMAEVRRGGATRPLYVSAAGMPLSDAAEAVRTMHGAFRLPTLIKRTDTLCRGAV
ncbi:MAG: endonuclease V [Armatimonadetes bacterium]|nr:endonuclease V [Armatimonadota bacterium]